MQVKFLFSYARLHNSKIRSYLNHLCDKLKKTQHNEEKPIIKWSAWTEICYFLEVLNVVEGRILANPSFMYTIKMYLSGIGGDTLS